MSTRGVRPPDAPAHYVEVNCKNPECDYTVWVPPNLPENTLAVCSPDCAKYLTDHVLDDETKVAVVDDAPLRPLPIERMFAYIASDETGEGIVAMTADGISMPLVGADAARMLSLRPIAERLVKQTGKPIKLVRFDQRTEIETIKP